MITRSSALLHRKANIDELKENQAHVLINLCQSKMSFECIAEVLNCSESLVRSVLARPFQFIDPDDDSHPIRTPGRIQVPTIPLGAGPTVPIRGIEPEGATARDQEDFARHLATEMRRWLCTFEMTDADRQRAVEQAGFCLEDAIAFLDGNYLYRATYVADEIIAVWKPRDLIPDDRVFLIAVGRRLAAWIRFWIPDPDSWSRALDLSFDYFEAAAQAA